MSTTSRAQSIRESNRTCALTQVVFFWGLSDWGIYALFNMGTLPFDEFLFYMFFVNVGFCFTSLIVHYYYHSMTDLDLESKHEKREGSFEPYVHVDPSTGEIDLSGEIPRGKLDFNPENHKSKS